MTSKIAVVANIAFQVFSQHSSRVASASAIGTHLSLPNDKLKQLLTLLNKVDDRDVGFDTNLAKSTVRIDGSNVPAPVVYVHIMENEVFSLGIFVLRPGSRIPLHDHPNMYGIVKVIHGNVRCRSFSRVFGNKSFIPRLCKWQVDDIIAAVPYQDTVLDCKSEPMMLTPSNGNYHELFTVGNEGAAFVDILAPPYDHFLGKRECRFYEEISLPQSITNQSVNTNQNGSSRSPIAGSGDINIENIDSVANNSSPNHNNPAHTNNSTTAALRQYIYLTETHQPKDYWCESAEYRGPRV